MPLLLISIFGLLSTDLKACTRTDLLDRTPQEVVEKSLQLAQEGDYSHVTGLVIVKKEKDFSRKPGAFSTYGSGVALDRYTVLTAAHFLLEDDEPAQVFFALHPNPMGSEVENIKISHIFPHPTFKKIETIVESSMTFKPNKTFDGIDPYSNDICLAGLTYPQIDQGPLNPLRGFIGVDIAILKLEKPLPENLIFPEILPKNYEVKDTYGICLGYGRMYYNYHDKGPTRVIEDQRESIMRHLISMKVNAYTSTNKGPVLYGQYKGLLVNGRYSFIPDSKMLKTEGMTVGGDSGGPMFIRHENKYKLIGITSYDWSALGDVILEPEAAAMLQGVTQPIFPVLVDIRTHREDITGFMGEDADFIGKGLERRSVG